MTRIVLASGSPRRAELLAAAGFEFEVRQSHLDERVRPGEGADDYVRRVATEKALAISGQAPGRAVLAADTVVVVDGRVLGKPDDPAEAKQMLRLLSGRAHRVLTGVCLVGPAGGERHGPAEAGQYPDTRVAVTEVEFASLTTDEIDWYVASGEGVDKAGAYAIQGLASRFVTRIEGSYTNVVGLPVALVYQMCARAGILLS